MQWAHRRGASNGRPPRHHIWKWVHELCILPLYTRDEKKILQIRHPRRNHEAGCRKVRRVYHLEGDGKAYTVISGRQVGRGIPRATSSSRIPNPDTVPDIDVKHFEGIAVRAVAFKLSELARLPFRLDLCSQHRKWVCDILDVWAVHSRKLYPISCVLRKTPPSPGVEMLSNLKFRQA